MSLHDENPQTIVDDLNELQDTAYWTEVLAKAYKRRTNLPSDSTAVVVHRDPYNGDETIMFKAITGYNEDGEPILVDRIAFPWSLYEYFNRLADDHPVYFMVAPWLVAGVSWLLLALMSRRSRNGPS